ncbi:MAG: flagellar hook-basal body protein [Verrucomicrobiota bacterium]
MNVSLYQAAAAMNANARWQDMISENLASGSTIGARSRDVYFSSVPAGPQFVIPAPGTGINFTPGELKRTGNPLDFAIEGQGFFEVQLPNGERAYTRDGEFHLSSTGQLVTKQGNVVSGEGGPLQFDINNTMPLTVSATGQVSQGGEIKGKLKLVEFNDPRLLTPITSGMFLADNPNIQAQAPTDTSISQGSVEASNISPTTQMADLIMAMRAFETNQKVIQMQDDRMGRTISELGSPT